jgi:pimeloyl-ACP methyl ester carboxylesterase
MIVAHLRSACWTILLFGSWCIPATVARGQFYNWSREQGIVFAAPGSGDFRLVVSSAEEAIERAGLPLRVASADWSCGGLVEDIRNHELHLKGGWRLAQRVMAYHQACPGRRVFLVGHSGGTAVVLAATHWLPPNSVERIVLLSPGVSSHHDLRCALTVSRCGIDNFFSREDTCLASLVEAFGTNDRLPTRSAGEVGFVPIITSPADVDLYRKLRQYPWRDEYADHGYQGGHLGVASRRFLSYAVIPMFAAP